ncbi:MAG: succinoglycan biosynthesis transport protein ExoP, partial [Myxococcota bacterium]
MNEPSSMGPLPGRNRGESSSVGALAGRVVADVSMNGASPTSGPGAPNAQDDSDSLFGLLQHYLQILLRRKLVVAIVLALAVGAGYLWLQQQTPIYRASASVIIDSNPPKVLMVRDVVELGSPTHYRGNLTYFETQYRVIKSFPVAKRALSIMGLWSSEHLLGLDVADPPLTNTEKEAAFEAAYMPGVLAGRLQVRPIPNSMLVNIEFEDPDPEFAKMIVNGVSKAYEAHNLAYKRTIMDNAKVDLQKETDLKRAQLDDADQALLTYETDHNVGSIEAKKKSINTRIDDNNAILTKTRSERIRLEAKAGTLRKYVDAKDPFGVDAAFILSDEVVRALKQRIVGVRAELAGLKSRYLDKHPETIAKSKELATLNTIARKEIRNLARSVQKQLSEVRRVEQGLQGEVDSAQVEQSSISGLSLAYNRLKDERDKLDDTYTLLSKRLTETKMSA